MSTLSFSRFSRRALTLVELMIVLAIIAILFVAGWGAWGKAKRKAEDTACVSVMRTSFYPGFGAYLAGNNQVWPQEPEDNDENPIDDERTLWKWWFETMEKHGVAREACLKERRVKVGHGGPNAWVHGTLAAMPCKGARPELGGDGAWVQTFDAGGDRGAGWRGILAVGLAGHGVILWLQR